MARNKRGIHAPNNWGQRTDLDKFLTLADTVGHVTMLDGEADLVPVLRQHGVDGTILVRMYLPKWSDVDPVQWAERCSVEYLRDRGGWTLAQQGAHLTPANEMNLEEEGGGSSAEWYRRINDWLVSWHVRFVQLVPGVSERLHCPAEAYGHSDDDASRGYCGEEIMRPAIERYAIKDKHPYWFTPEQVTDKYYGHRFILTHERFPTKPIFLSEAGNFAVTRTSSPDEFERWFTSLSGFPYITGATPFIFRDPTGAHAQNNWGANLAIEQRVIQMAGGTSGGGGTVPTVGAGFQKCVPYIGAFVESEVYHFAGTPRETSLAIAEHGYATWRKATNETVCHCDDGRILSDFGNEGDGSGRLVQVYPKA